MGAYAQDLTRRLSKLQTLRSPHEQPWRDCFDHSFTIRGSGLQQSSLTAQQALDIKARIVDSTATDAGRILAAALQAGMTPANARWFGMGVGGADDASKRWLDEAAEQLHQEIHNANFDAVGYECNVDIVVAGWFVMYIDTDREKGGLRFEAWPLAQCFIASSKAGGAIDTVYRRYQLTATQVVTEFGAKASQKVQQLAQTDPDAQIEMLHAIQPRKLYVVGSKMGKNMPFSSCHLEVATSTILRESGYKEFPCAVPRWSLIPDSAYAVGPMFDALPDVRELNDFKRMDKASADIAISGMWIATDDGVLNPRTVKVGPRKVIVANSVDSMKPLLSGANWQLADERISQLQAAIRKVLMADQLTPQDGPAMTATEVHARVALIRQQLGPLFGRMQAEYLQQLIDRCFSLAFDAGIFAPPPPQLVGRTFAVHYISPLARAQKLEDVTAIQQLNATILPMLQFKPEIADNIDFDAQAHVLAEALGVPKKSMRDPDQVVALRDERQKQQAQQAQAAQQQQLQTMAADASFKGATKRAA